MSAHTEPFHCQVLPFDSKVWLLLGLDGKITGIYVTPK